MSERRSLSDNPVLRDIRTSLYSTSRATFSWGKAKGDVKQLKAVKSGAAIKVEKVG
jgi:hypothetical protein